MPAARPTDEGPTAAFVELRNNLAYANNLINGSQRLSQLKVGAFDVEDLNRAAWVQAVSSLDHWIHRELYDRALAFALNPEIPRPNRFLKIEVPMGLFEDVHHHDRNLRAVFHEHLLAKFGYQSFQAPEKIRQALLYVSDADLWPQVAKQLSMEPAAVLATLNTIVKRRNKIAHEADRDLTNEHDRQPLPAEEARGVIQEVERIAGACRRRRGSRQPERLAAQRNPRTECVDATNRICRTSRAPSERTAGMKGSGASSRP